MRGEEADFQEGRAGVEQPVDPFSRQKLAAALVQIARAVAAARERQTRGCPHGFQSGKPRRLIGTEGLAARRDFGREHRHGDTAAINSRPISIRRISLVPAPISISLASRNNRLTGVSFMNPVPPIACTA